MTSTESSSWNLYSGYSGSVTIPYAGYTAKGSSPEIPISVDGGSVKDFTIDTGSLGLVVPKEDVPTTLDYTSGTPGEIRYGSSGDAYAGYWITTTVSLTGADGTSLTDADGSALTEQLPVLVVTQSYHDGVALSGDQGAPTQLGVGFGRPATDTDGVALTLANNAFLNLPGEADGMMRPGYILGQTSVTIGLTDDNADSGWALSKLTPRPDGSTSVSGAADWADPASVITVNGQTSTGTELVDTGLSHAELGWPEAPSSGKALPLGTTVTTDLLGIGDRSVSYSYSLGDDQPQTPSRGGTSTGTTTFSNTTDTLLNGLNYLYDATGGYVGFEPNSGGGNLGSTFTEELAASGTITLPDGFSSTVPTELRDATTLSDAGSASFGGAFSGSAPLTLTGGGTFTFSGGGTVSGGIVLSVGTLRIDGTFKSGQATIFGTVILPAATAAAGEHWNILGGLNAAGGVIIVGAAAELSTTDELTIEKGGSLVLGQAASVTGSLTLENGNLYSQNGSAGAGGVSLAGAITLGGTSDTIDLGLNNAISLEGTISGGTTNGLKIIGTGTLELDGQNSFAGGISIGQTAKLMLDATAAAGTGPIGFVPATVSTDPLPETVAGVLGGTAAVLEALDLSGSRFGLGNGIDVTDLSPKTSANSTGRQVTTSYDPTTGQLAVLGDNSTVATIALPTGLNGTFSVASDGNGGTTLTLVHGTSNAVTVATRSNLAATDYGVSGAGITVGIISSSFNAQGGLYQDVADGALPASVLSSYNPALDASSGPDEGRAMAQLVHDIAPNATLKFATADGSGTVDQDLAAAIEKLIAARCNIIVDDIGEDPGSFYSLPPATAKAIQDATNDGITMVTSATNRGDVFYEHAVQVVSGTLSGDTSTENIYDFGTAASPQLYQKITIQNNYSTYLNLQSLALSGSFTMTAHFFTEIGGVYTPLNLKAVASDAGSRYLLPTSGTTGSTDLCVAFTTDQSAPDGIFKYTIGPASEPLATIDDNTASVGSGSITGHQLDPNEITVGAADYRGTLSGGTLTSADFSSSGPGVLYTAPDGSRYATPLTLSKPDITAPEHTSTTVTAPTETLPDGVGGLSTFSGTSAAAPAFAGVAALMLQADPHLTGNDIRNLTSDSAIAMVDRSVAGAGLVQADKAVGYASTHVITQFAGGNTNLLGTSGNETIVTNSGATTVDGGGGSDTISAGGQSTSIVGGSGHLLVNVTSGSVSLSGGTGNATVTGGTGDLLIGGSAGSNTLTGGGGGAIWGGGAGDRLFGGVGDLIGAAASGNTTLVGSAGNVLVDRDHTLAFTGSNVDIFGAQSGSDVVVGTGDFTAVGRGGQTTVFGGTDTGTTWAGASHVTDVAGTGRGTLVAGSSESVLWINQVAGAQTVLGVNGAGGGSVDIVGFRPGTDSVSTAGYATAATQSVSNGSLTLTLADHTSITFLSLISLS